MGTEPLRSQARLPIRTAVLVFLFLNFTYLLTSTGRVHTIDEISAVMQTESLVVRGSTAIPQAVGSGVYYGKLDVHGQPRSPYPPGQSLAIAPWYVLGAKVIAPLARVPRESLDLVLSMAATWSTATYAALTVALAFLLVCSLGVNRRDALLITGALAFASPLFVYSAWLFSEPLTSVLWMGASLALFGTPANEGISPQRAAIGGILLGSSLYVRPTNAIAAGIFILAIWIRSQVRNWRPAAVVAALVTAAGLLYLWRNAHLYGNFSDFGYPSAAEGGRELNTFHTPFVVGFSGFLLSPGKSVFLFFPLLALAVAAIPRLWRMDRGLAFVCAGTPTAYVLFYARYTQWEGIYCWGPRYLVPALVLMGIALSAWFFNPPEWFPRAFAWLFALGVAIQIIGLSTNIVEDMVKNHYYYANWQYRWDYSEITGQLRLISKYLGGAPAPLGYGFDRWFVFIAKAGAPTSFIGLFLLPMVAGFVASGWLLVNQWRHLRR